MSKKNKLELEGRINNIKKIETKTGTPMTKASIGLPGTKNADGTWDNQYMDVVAFGEVAIKLLSVPEKTDVLITGRIGINKWTNKEGVVVKNPQCTLDTVDVLGVPVQARPVSNDPQQSFDVPF